MPDKQKTAAKTPRKPRQISVSMPKDLVDQIDILADFTRLSRVELIETLLRESLDNVPAPAVPRPCPRGHIRPCERARTPAPLTNARIN